jgi:hypothetical protein
LPPPTEIAAEVERIAQTTRAAMSDHAKP